jgi:hypothetical protein
MDEGRMRRRRREGAMPAAGWLAGWLDDYPVRDDYPASGWLENYYPVGMTIQ